VNITINDVAIDADEWPSRELAAVRELLRQQAVALGLLEADADDAAVTAGIEQLLAREVTTPSPTEDECRRYYDVHAEEFRSGDLVCARHILFQITPGCNVELVRAEAEQTLAQLLAAPDDFEACALTLSNCPSGRQGGNLGQISRGDTVPEFERALFRLQPTGILRELVKTRHGFHIVAVDQRIPGATLPFEVVRDRVAEQLKAGVEERALRQYVSILAGQAKVSGLDLQSATSPLVQ
jgi:peptidyl-prolyl cis-trans isomerase C